MKTLDVPTTSISAVKKSPVKVFEESKRANNGVYVFNHGDVAGIMLNQDLYEEMAKEIEYLREEILKYRLKDTNVKTYMDEEVRGKKLGETVIVDDNDGWE